MSRDAIIAEPLAAALGFAAEVLADVLDRQVDYRVLRRMRIMDRRESLGFSAATLRGACVDVETTGLDASRRGGMSRTSYS